jgi:putative ABC transport system ATP-binding protein
MRRARNARVGRGRAESDTKDRGGPRISPAGPGGPDLESRVRLRAVSKRYGCGPTTVEALREVDLDVRAAEFVAVIGPRGSGKTTLIEVVGATQRPTSGEVLVCGRRIDDLDDRGRLEFRTANIALAPQVPTLAPTLTVHETVVQAARMSRLHRPERKSNVLISAFDLQLEADVLVANLSAESQQRLSVARALAKDAPLLLLDEPLSAAPIDARRRLLAAVPELVPPDSAIVLTTPDTEATPSVDRVVRLA